MLHTELTRYGLCYISKLPKWKMKNLQPNTNSIQNGDENRNQVCQTKGENVSDGDTQAATLLVLTLLTNK